MKPEAPVTSVGFTDLTPRRHYLNAHVNILKLSASLALIPSAAEGS
jgi:hypothetical protein